ncbi:37-kD nucleoid-associated bacterial protein [Oxobacter pfennigii]|uniref:37-kD nucleoid-associated bacterial protein n=1 Tax=Oxobacter pfennigii TaxID=36849 RepID=A0A0P8YGV8_9CLOT|nr:nucleoid-associated protein [Oxobacter pfennigii]KPU46306.1 37-kD nucleoid-associated bacterial protein [Oxobacter pfennigii]
MTTEVNVYIKKIIVHILDSSTGVPVLSDLEHPMDDDIDKFLVKHISKVLNDDSLKTAYFKSDECKFKILSQSLAANRADFVPITQDAASTLFNIMESNVDIPPADLVCCLLDMDGTDYLGILKFNYRPSYIHYVKGDTQTKVNSIVKQKTSLAGENQKVDECALINLEDFSVKIIEKKYEINGEKEFYFSDIYLGCRGEISEKQKAKLFKKVTDNFNKKFCPDDIEKSADIRRAINEYIDENEEINVERIAESAFKRAPDLKKAYMEHAEKAGLTSANIAVDPEYGEKIFKRHKIKTDTGIEINLPVDQYTDRAKIEFINNPDGTISIIIKNIKKITDL